MIIETVSRINHMMTPNRWPRVIRRMFVILSPVSVPLLFVFWVSYLLAMVGVFFVGLVFCLVNEILNALVTLWQK